MRKFEIKNSLKDIPTPGNKKYLLQLTARIEDVIERMRWRTFFYTKKQGQDGEKKETFGFNTQRTPPHNKLLAGFEKELLEVIGNIQFKTTQSNHQRKLMQVVKNIRQSPEIIVKADKTRNFYKLDFKAYDKILTETITKNYQKVEEGTTDHEHQINTEAKNITEKLKISDRVEKIQHKASYFLVKDHKSDFLIRPATRLINPTRTEIGRISKQILEKINYNVRNKLKLNQWINTNDAIEWFKQIKEKRNAAFIQFDIESFYPSISETTFKTAIKFAQEHTRIKDNEIEIIMHCRRTILFKHNQQWIKCNRNDNNQNMFDISMGSLDSSQASDLVGLLILSKITNTTITQQNVGLYRDDGLVIIQDSTAKKCDTARKHINKIFEELGLKVTIETNMKKVDFLDVTLNLYDNTYQPYMKENTTPIYVNTQSNHPPKVIQKIPTSISDRLSRNSSNIEIFDRVKKTYQSALKRVVTKM